MPSAPTVVRDFSPLDRRLGLLLGELTPDIQEMMVRLGSWMPFEPAAKLLEAFTGVCISKSTGHRLTEATGAKLVEQQEQRVIALEAGAVEVATVDELLFCPHGLRQITQLFLNA